MTQPPGDGEPPQNPYGVPPQRPQPDESEQPGYWQQQSEQAGPPPYPPQGYDSHQGYGPPPGYGPPYSYTPAPPNHGGALTAMIVGIVSLVLACGYGVGLLGSPVAWFLGRKAMREIDSAPGQYSGRGMAQAGMILGIIGTVLLVLLILAVGVLLVVAISTGASNPAGY